MVQPEMDFPFVELASDGTRWIYRVGAKPELGEGGIVPPRSVLAPEAALGSVPTVALSSAQVRVVVAATPDVARSRAAWRLVFLLSRAQASLRSRSAKICAARPASWSWGVM